MDVTHDYTLDEARLRRLARLLPEVIAQAVACPDEPWTGPSEPGDIEIRFRRKSELDVGDLNVVIEVRTKLLHSRVTTNSGELISSEMACRVSSSGRSACG